MTFQIMKETPIAPNFDITKKKQYYREALNLMQEVIATTRLNTNPTNEIPIVSRRDMKRS